MSQRKGWMVRGAALILVVVIAGACSGSAGDDLTATEPAASTRASLEPETPEPTPDPTPKPISVTVTKRTKSVAQSDTASITIKTVKDAECSIEVLYDSGPSEAKGLGKKNSGSDGTITWKWLVGSNAAAGDVPIEVYCVSAAGEGSVSTSFTVK